MKFYDLHTHKKKDYSSIKNEVISIKNAYDQVLELDKYYSFGIHPLYIDESIDQLVKVKQYLADDSCLALGEVGLDKRGEVAFEKQHELLIQQLDFNKTYNKPVVIHCVKSFQEIIAIKKNYDFPFIMHGFKKKEALAQQLIKEGFYLSFGSALLNNDNAIEVFKNIDLNHVFLESDMSGKEIEFIYQTAAKIKDISIEKLTFAIEQNFNKTFIHVGK